MPTIKRPVRLLRKFVWWLVLLVSVNIAFYIVIPLVAANYIKRHLEAQGYTDVEVELGYPGPRGTHMPFLTMQKDLADEHLSLTIRNLEITYLLTDVLQGHLHDIVIERISLELTALPDSAQSTVSEPGRLSPIHPTPALPVSETEGGSIGATSLDSEPTSLVGLARLLPVLPFESFSLQKVSIYRSGATGPFRRMEMSGSIENQDGELKGIMTFRGEKIIPYSLLISLKPSGDISVILRSNELLSDPLLFLDSRIESSQQAGIILQGSLNADLKQLTPFLALFMPLGSDLHKVDGHFLVDWAGTTSHDVTLQTLFQDAATSLSGRFQLDLRLPAWAGVAEDIDLKVHGEVAALPEELKVDITTPTGLTARLHADALSVPPDVKVFLVDAEDHLLVQVKDHFSATLSFTDDLYNWTVEGNLQAQYGKESSPVGIQATLSSASGDSSQLLETEGHFHGWGRVFYVPAGWPPVDRLDWDIRGSVTSAQEQVAINLAPDSFISSKDLRKGQLHIPEVLIRLNEVWRILYDFQFLEWKADLLSLPIRLPRFFWDETETEIEKTTLHISQLRGDHDSWEVNGKIMMGGIDAKNQSVMWPLSNGGIGFWAKPPQVTLGIRLETVDKSVTAQTRLVHNLQTQQGNLFATLTPQPFSESRHRLSQVITPWPYLFDVTGGEISANASAAWGADPRLAEEGLQMTRGEFTLSASHVDGVYDKMKVKDINATVALVGTGLDHVAMPVPAAVTIGSLEQGIMAKDVSFLLQLGFDGVTMIPTLDLKGFSAGAFGGKITSPRIYLNMEQETNAFVLQLDNLKLADILRLEQQPHMESTGLLKGFVPITLKGSDLEIHDGKVDAQPPGGIIRFQPLEDAEKNLTQIDLNMDLVLRALTNFHYDVLSVGVNYAPNGTLKLLARLEGKNPDMEGGQPIHFNMNIEENIPALLESLSVVNGIQQQIHEVSR